MIYVDEPRRYNTPLRFKVWSHMWSDECDQELHEMADKIGLSRSWFQQTANEHATDLFRRLRNHYDVTPGKRALAIQFGAQQITTEEYYHHVRRAIVIPWHRVRVSEEEENLIADYYGDPDRYGHS